jgi:hypothetical protein
MRRLFAAGLIVLAGCMAGPPPYAPVPVAVPAYVQNPVLLPGSNHELVWEVVVDVIDDYFEIDQEEPVRLLGSHIIDGRIDTWPRTGATVFEPWHRDSADSYERLESTLQSIRRYAQVRVMPRDTGFLVEVAVFKELEDVDRPVRSTAGSATLHNDTSLTRIVNPVGEQPVRQGWINLGRDLALEQQILGDLTRRMASISGAVATR